jgi:hypothetical protein
LTEYLWEGLIHEQLTPGAHVINIVATDDWWEYRGARIIHVRSD